MSFLIECASYDLGGGVFALPVLHERLESAVAVRRALESLAPDAVAVEVPSSLAHAFSRAVDGGETIVDGNDVDTAPRQLHNLGIHVKLGASVDAGLDAQYVGRYWLDAANTASYPGHEVANLRLQWRPGAAWVAALRVDNLFDTAYADRADFAFGNYRYFPARGRAVFVSLDYTLE